MAGAHAFWHAGPSLKALNYNGFCILDIRWIVHQKFTFMCLKGCFPDVPGTCTSGRDYLVRCLVCRIQYKYYYAVLVSYSSTHVTWMNTFLLGIWASEALSWTIHHFDTSACFQKSISHWEIGTQQLSTKFFTSLALLNTHSQTHHA